jgi:two-component sensor histidine kinase
MSLLRPSVRFPLQRRVSANNEVKGVLAAVQDQLQNCAQVHHALRLPERSNRIDVAAYLQQLCRGRAHYR